MAYYQNYQDQPDYTIQPFERGSRGKPYEKSIKDDETTPGTSNETNTDPQRCRAGRALLEKYDHTSQHTQRGNQEGYDDQAADYRRPSGTPPTLLGEDQGDETSWMAVSNTNPPTRGATRMGPPTTTTTSIPPPPPPQLQETNMPLPPQTCSSTWATHKAPRGSWKKECGNRSSQGKHKEQREQPAETLFNNTTLAGPFLLTKGQRGWEARAATKGPLQQQPAATGPGGARGAPHSQQQPQQQQPYLPRQATTGG